MRDAKGVCTVGPPCVPMIQNLPLISILHSGPLSGTVVLRADHVKMTARRFTSGGSTVAILEFCIEGRALTVYLLIIAMHENTI